MAQVFQELQVSDRIPLGILAILVLGHSSFLQACGGSEGEISLSSNRLSLTMLCEHDQVYSAAPNSVSFVFKAQSASGKPITDLSPNDMKINDGGDTTSYVDTDGTIRGLESGSARLGQAVGVRVRTLVLIDGSGSLYDQEVTVKAVVRGFIENSDPKNVIGIYKFYDGTFGGQRASIVPIYPFTPERDALLYCMADDDGTLLSAQSNDRVTMVSALEADSLMLQDSSTALFDALQAGLGELESSSPPATVRTPVQMKTLLLLTDGRDEVSAGGTYMSKRQSVVDAAVRFRSSSENLILVAGIQRAGQKLDAEFLGSIASYYTESSLDDLNNTFAQFSKRASDEGKKFYKFNICSNRRGQMVDANLAVTTQAFGSAELPFHYDATAFYNGTERCDPALFAGTCRWTAGPALQPDRCASQ